MQFHHLITGEIIEPEEWQLQLKVGDHYRIDRPYAMVGDTTYDMPTIYGRIESDEDCPSGFFYVRAFSQYCPHGELGLMCLVEPSCLITEEEFYRARAEGWPVTKTRPHVFVPGDEPPHTPTRRARIVTGKPHCDLQLGTEVVCFYTDDELAERQRLGESITIYTEPDDDHPAGEEYHVTLDDIEIIN